MQAKSYHCMHQVVEHARLVLDFGLSELIPCKPLHFSESPYGISQLVFREERGVECRGTPTRTLFDIIFL